MAEPAFFPPSAVLTFSDIATATGASPPADADRDREISGAAPLDLAGAGDVSFLEGADYLPALATTKAGACFCRSDFVGQVPAGTVALEVAEPLRAFAIITARLFATAMRPQPVLARGISAAAHIDPSATIESDVTIEANAVVGAGAEIGRGTLIGPGTIVGPGVRIGRDCAIAGNVSLFYALIGNRVIIHSGAAIGQDGFGFVPGAGGHVKVPQIGRAIIQDDVEIGANSCIDRGSGRDTIIGEGTKIDNLVQIGHNTTIGRHCLLAGEVGVSGSVVVGDFVMMGGAVGVCDHLTIGRGVRLGAGSLVTRDIPAGETWFGYPAAPMAEWRREKRALMRVMSQAKRRRGAGGKEGEDDG